MFHLLVHESRDIKTFLLIIDDDAYVKNEDDLANHLVNEVGTIWKGMARQPRPLLWEYGQVSSRASQLSPNLSILTIIDLCSIPKVAWVQHFIYSRDLVQTTDVQQPLLPSP